MLDLQNGNVTLHHFLNLLEEQNLIGICRFEKKKRREGTIFTVTMDEGGPSKSPEIFIAFHFQFSITMAKPSVSDSNVIGSILCPSAGTAQCKL